MSHRSTRGAAIAALIALPLLGASAIPARRAPAPIRPASPSGPDTSMSILRDSGGQLEPIRWIFVSRLMGSGLPARLGFRTLQVTPATVDGRVAWLIVDSRQLATIVLADSLYVSREGLAPIRRVAHTPDESVTAVYGRDSIVATFEGDRGHQVVSAPSAPDLVPNLYVLEALLHTSPLASGWSRTANLLAMDRSEVHQVPVTLKVTRSDSVLVPDGKFDCWVVSLGVGKGEQQLWVRKSDRVLIKETMPVVGQPGMQLELLLAEKGVR